MAAKHTLHRLVVVWHQRGTAAQNGHQWVALGVGVGLSSRESRECQHLMQHLTNMQTAALDQMQQA